MAGTSENDFKQELALGELELAFELDQLQRAKTVHIGDTKSREARIAGLEKDVARCTTLLANFKVTRTTPRRHSSHQAAKVPCSTIVIWCPCPLKQHMWHMACYDVAHTRYGMG